MKNRPTLSHIRLQCLVFLASLIAAGLSWSTPPGESATIQATAFVQVSAGVHSVQDSLWYVHSGSFSSVVVSLTDESSGQRWRGRIDVPWGDDRTDRCQPVRHVPAAEVMQVQNRGPRCVITILDPAL
ncbi:hypothetical protein GF356_01360 [candidate division GN15 bacterium]|nr:hypothetical protein [candidate division GN15 bacterium]